MVWTEACNAPNCKLADLPTMPALPEHYRLGQYRIIRLLGEGGMGAVYEARHESLDRRVAVKTLHAEVAANQQVVGRFFNEAKVLSRLEHPSIVQVSDFGTAPDGISYLVMEYLRGESLGKRIRTLNERGERLPLIPALQIAWQVADVLAMAHSQGIVHRDIKPENLMLVADPIAPSGERVKVLDFGIAKLTGEGPRSGAKTDTQALMGTPMYMSPEQCSGAGRVDDKTDVYALGCVLYQMLAGRPPFEAEGAGELIGMHLFHTPPPLAGFAPKLPTSVIELVERMLLKDKLQRPDMATIADQIGRLLTQFSGGAMAVNAQTHRSPIERRTSDAGIARPVTTLGHSAGQTATQQRKRRWLLLGGTLAVSVTAFLVYSRVSSERTSRIFLEQHRTASPAVAPLVPAIAQPITPSTIHWRLATEPNGALVVDQKGKVVGVTPWIYEQDPVPGQQRFRLKLDGYLDAELSLDTASDADEKVVLKKKPATTGKQTGALRGSQSEKKREIGYED